MGAVMEGPVETADDGDADDALWGGFQAAIQKVLDSYKNGECDAKECGKKIADWVKAHEKLAGTDEPEEAEESEEDDDSAEKKDKEKMESEQELAALRGEKKVRELCESLSFTPTQLQVESLTGLSSDANARP